MIHYLNSQRTACKDFVIGDVFRWTRIKGNVTCRQCRNALAGRA